MNPLNLVPVWLGRERTTWVQTTAAGLRGSLASESYGLSGESRGAFGVGSLLFAFRELARKGGIKALLGSYSTFRGLLYSYNKNEFAHA